MENELRNHRRQYALRFDENSVLRVTRKRGPTVLYMR